MRTAKWLQGVALLGLLLWPAVPAQAQRLPRVRPERPELRKLIAEGAHRSATFRALVDQLEATDLIVELRCGRFRSSRLAGRTMLLSGLSPIRYVLVEIVCPAPAPSAVAILAHEFRHALEIADEPSVVDDRTMRRLYSQIGFPSCGGRESVSTEYETADALDTGERVHHEMLHTEDRVRRPAQVLASRTTTEARPLK